MIISLIAAISKNNVIGVDGDLPWSLPKDMRFFSTTTKGHHVLMGRKNFDSIPDKYRPLPDRPNLVVTRQEGYKAEGAQVFNSIEEAVDFTKTTNETELFIIGGGEIYNQTIHLADKIYLTRVDAKINGDAYFPVFNESSFERKEVFAHEKDDLHNYAFKIYEYIRKQP